MRLARCPRWVLVGLPLGSCVLVLATYVALIITAKARGTYTGGLDLPYFSDTGRDKPAYYAFAVNLSVGAVAYLVTHIMVANHLLTVLSAAKEGAGEEVARRGCCDLRISAWVAASMAVLSAPALVLLACFDTAKHASVHNNSAYAFFGLNTVALTVYAVVFWFMPDAAKDLDPHLVDALALSAKVKAAVAAVFWVAFLLYIPIGLGAVCSFDRLSMADCLGKEDLGVSYCEDMQRSSDPTETYLWDYSNCTGTNLMRSAAQFCCIMLLMVFSGSLAYDLNQAGGVEIPSRSADGPARDGSPTAAAEV